MTMQITSQRDQWPHRVAVIPPVEQLTKIPVNGGRWRYVHEQGPDDPEAREYHRWGIHPTDSPASKQFEYYGRQGTIHYDPALTDVASDDMGRMRPTNPGNRITDLNPPPGMLWRGMDDEEYQQAKQRGYFQSNESMKLGEGQAGKTFFSTGPDHAESYANSFTPVEYLPTFSKPAHIIGIPDRPDVLRGPLGDQPDSHEVGVSGQIPFASATHHYVGHPVAIVPGEFGMNRGYQGWEPGGGSHPRSILQWGRE